MPKIMQLDPHVADLIAAGEVVERPASVVKELMENSIDAGASAVTVEIQRGGMSYIRVTDNGCGISPEDAETAFLRHATSKIRNEYDLEAIGTLGFRGEALAAISAVSHIELMTRRQEDDFGTALLLDAGVVRTREETGCPVGTTMIVRDLFFNTPARLKFMKRDTAEGAAVFAVVQHTALSHPETAVTFIKDGKQELQTPGDGKLQSALYAVLGRDVALGYLPVKGSSETLTVEGYASMPACCRGTRGYQHFFVNGRYVKSRTMTAALEEAYKNQKMVGKFPGCVLHITAKLNAVDVNVHPTKTEVKFLSEKQLFDAIYHSVKDCLDGTAPRLALELEKPAPGAAPAIAPRPVKTSDEPYISVPKERADAAPLEPGPHVSYPGRQNFFQTMTAAEYRAQAAEQRLKEEKKQAEQPAPAPAPAKAPEVVPIRDRTELYYDAAPNPAAAALRHAEELTEEAPEEAFTIVKKGTPAQALAAAPAPEEKKEPAVFAEPPETVQTSLIPEEELPEEEKPVPWHIAGELFSTYILVEQGDRVILIDKHAAHERMNFNRLKKQNYRPMCQQLLTPIVFTPEAEEGTVLLANLPLLLEFGFEVEDFGSGALIIRQIPADIDPDQAESTLSELGEKLMTCGTLDPDAQRDDMLHTIACKAAIKGGQKNGPEELQIVAEAVMRDEVRYCPHGRPVAIELTRKQLEKQFRRIV